MEDEKVLEEQYFKDKLGKANLTKEQIKSFKKIMLERAKKWGLKWDLLNALR